MHMLFAVVCNCVPRELGSMVSKRPGWDQGSLRSVLGGIWIPKKGGKRVSNVSLRSVAVDSASQFLGVEMANPKEDEETHLQNALNQ